MAQTFRRDVERPSVGVFCVRVLGDCMQWIRGDSSGFGALQGALNADVIAIVGNDEWALSVLQELRLRGVSTPILVLRQSHGTHGAVALLNGGADSCLSNECDHEERDAVVSAMARRGALRSLTHGSQPMLNDSARTLFFCGESFKFGPVAYSVVRYLVMNQNVWVSQREIIEHAIATHYRPDSSVARVQIHQIRKVLGAYRWCIQQDGKRGCGYMFSVDEPSVALGAPTFAAQVHSNME